VGVILHGFVAFFSTHGHSLLGLLGRVFGYQPLRHFFGRQTFRRVRGYQSFRRILGNTPVGWFRRCSRLG
jgi:hypothetical protein